MEEKKNEAIPQPTVEQLKMWLNKATQDNHMLVEKYQQLANIFNVLPWLFKVLEHQAMFDAEFVNKCADTIQNMLTPVTETEDTEDGGDEA